MKANQYDLIVIGGGSGGLVVAAGAAKLGARVALVEKHRLGGDCLWTGCVPSKALLHAAKVAHTVRTAGRVGIKTSQNVDFGKVLDYVHGVQKQIAPHDSPERFRRMGVDVVFGSPEFLGRLAFLKGPVVTSAHRFLRDGIIRQIVRNQLLKLLYHLGVPPKALKRIYEAPLRL